jgi:hypothetical protein
MNESRSTFDHPSLWGACRVIEVRAADGREFAEPSFRSFLSNHFDDAEDAKADAVNLLRHGGILRFGAPDDATADAMARELTDGQLICSHNPQLEHLRHPAYLAPDDAFTPFTWLLRVSSPSLDSDTIAESVSEVLQVSVPEALAMIERSDDGQVVSILIQGLHNASSLEERFKEVGYTAQITSL